tara:strand:+ start:352 stop:573 length:222 start_codon:yes stop_codon:yes gene_type:complete
MKNLELTFINYNTKDIININVESTIMDAYIHNQGYLEMINTSHPNIDWLTFLAEKKTNKNLNQYNLHSVDLLN